MKRKTISCYYLEPELSDQQRVLTLPYKRNDYLTLIKNKVVESFDIPFSSTLLYKPKVLILGRPSETASERVEELFLNGDVEPIDLVGTQSEYWSAELLPEEERKISFNILVITKQGLEDLEPIQSLPREFRFRRHALQERNKVLEKPVGLTPSEAGGHPQLHFDNAMLMAGRPMQRYSVPTAVYSPELARIMNQFGQIGEVEATESMVRHAANLVSVGAELYKDEDAREKATTELLNSIFGPGVWQGRFNEGKAKPDSSWDLSMVLELKNEKGMGGNALLQTLVSRLHIIKHSKANGKFLNTNFPGIVIAMSSTLFEVGLTVMTEVLLVDKVFQIDIPGGRDMATDTITLARALQIIVDGVGNLTKYYSRIRAQDTDNRADYLYPNPICQASLQPPLDGKLTFLHKLSPRDIFPESDAAYNQSTVKRLELSMTLFRAKMDNNIVMVKFTPTYNAEAHRLLEAAGLAPELIYHEKMVGGWFLIVMAYLDKARNAFAYLYNQPIPGPGGLLPRSVYQDVERALEVLHGKHIVFGDVRLQNVMVQEDEGRVRGYLVDFDSCGVEGEDRYPVFLSKIKIYQDAGMEPYGRMLMVHDILLLEEFKVFCEAE